MHLPSEILLFIYSHLPKSSLKAVRLACKRFYEIATPILFNSIFVSARLVDLKVADLVALRFPALIKTLKLSSQPFDPIAWPVFRDISEFRSSPCIDLPIHLKKAKLFWRTCCKLDTERRISCASGAVQAQVSRLLNTLPNIRHIIITDGRRRQNLSWLQEALMDEATQHILPSVSRINVPCRIRHSLADLYGSRKIPHSHVTFKQFWLLFRPSPASRKVQDLTQPQETKFVGCGCFDQESPFPRPISSPRTQYMPHNPWAVIMTALRSCSDNALTPTISVQTSDTNCYRSFVAIETFDPYISLSTSAMLSRLTRLELRLYNFIPMNDAVLGGMVHELRHPTRMLSAVPSLQSLTIDLGGFHSFHHNNAAHTPSHTTAFSALLGGCQLTQLSTLHLCNLTFLQNDFSTFLQHSPGLRDLNLRDFHMVKRWHFQEVLLADPRSWERLFDTIKQALPLLEDFYLSNRQICTDEHRWPGLWSRKVSNKTIQQFLFHEGMNPFLGIHDHGAWKDGVL